MLYGQYNTPAQRVQGDNNNQNNPSTIASYCGKANKHGKGWKGTCPICRKHSLSVTYGRQVSILIKCWHCEACGINNGYTEQQEYFIGVGLLEPTKGTWISKEQYEKWNAERRAEAVRIWQNRLGTWRPITADSYAGIYLRARGLESFIGHPVLRCTGGQLLARVWHVHHGITAVQATWLNEDGSDRDRERVPGRLTCGVLSGGALWIGAPVADEEFVVAEGLETCLSAMLILNMRCGAAVLGPNLKSLVLPSNTRRLHIAADNDDTGRGASACAAKLWRAQGLSVRVTRPEREGADFNDALLEGVTQ